MSKGHLFWLAAMVLYCVGIVVALVSMFYLGRAIGIAL